MKGDDDLREALEEAVELLRRLARPAMDLFGDAPPTTEEMTPAVAHAVGLVEGAAVALRLTPVELLDEYALEF